MAVEYEDQQAPGEQQYRGPGGRLTAPIPGSEKHRITPDNARLMIEKRTAKHRMAARRWITEEAQAIDVRIQTSADAWGYVASKQYLALLDSEKPRGDDLYRIGQIMGAVPLPHELRSLEQQGPAVVTITLPAEAGAALVRMLAELAGRDVIDGAATDAE